MAYRSIKVLLAVSIALATFVCCLKSVDPNGKLTDPASCSECHKYPGSDNCKANTVLVNNVPMTSCSFCHMGSIKLDSSYDKNGFKIFHDRMLKVNDTYIPLTDTSHTNARKDVMYGQCTMCHGYPPATGKHEKHVLDNQKKCFECHLNTVQWSLQVDTLHQGMHHPVHNNNKTIVIKRLIQKVHPGIYFEETNDSIPFANNTPAHLNKQFDVVFKSRSEDSLNNANFNKTQRIWNGFTRSCYYMNDCHAPEDSVRRWGTTQ